MVDGMGKEGMVGEGSCCLIILYGINRWMGGGIGHSGRKRWRYGKHLWGYMVMIYET